MTDLNVALVVRLIDQLSGPGGKVVDTLKRMGGAAGEFRRAFSNQIKAGFSADNIAAALAKNERDIAAARGRLAGAFGMALTLGAPVMAAGNFERDLIAFGNLADLDKEKLAELSKELDALSRRDRTGMTSGDLLAGMSTYVGKGLSQDDSLAALEATGRAAKATGAQFGEMAAAGFAAMDNLKVTPEQLRKAFDIMAASGKEGSFELRDMARTFPELTAGAQSIGMKGVEGVASLSAALQIAMKSAGSADQAASNTSNFLGKLSSPETVRNFKKFGVDIQKELETAAANGIDPLEHMLTVIDGITGGDQFKMGELFGDKQVLDFLRAAIPNLEEYRRIKAAALAADGVVDKDYDKVLDGFNESLVQLRQSITGLFSSSGVLLPALTEIIQGMTSAVDAVRDWTMANPELTAWLVKGAAAMLALGIGSRVLGYAFAVGRGNLIRFLSLFLKFDDAGRNISLVGKLLRGLGHGFSWAKVIPKLAWKGLIAPLRWASYLPKLAWKGLIAPLRWASYLPKLAWSSVIGVLNWAGFLPKKLLLKDFGPGVTQIGPAMEAAATRTEAATARMNRAIAGVHLKSLSAGLMMFSTISQMPNDPAKLKEWQAGNRKYLEDTFRATPGLGQLMSGYEKARNWLHGGTPEETTARREAEARKARVRREVEAATGYGVVTPAERDYPYSPHFTDWQKVRPGGISMSPPAGAGGAGAAIGGRAAPVKVEETINHDYKSDVAVTVTVPVQITNQIAADRDRIARDVGARTERAVRGALSDSAGPQ